MATLPECGEWQQECQGSAREVLFEELDASFHRFTNADGSEGYAEILRLEDPDEIAWEELVG